MQLNRGNNLSKYHTFLSSNKYKLLTIPAAGAIALCLASPEVAQSPWAALYWAVLFSTFAAFYVSPWELTQWNLQCHKDLARSAELRRMKLVTPVWCGYLVEYEFLTVNSHPVRLKIKDLLAIPKR